jgi:hypothetical protein
MRVIVAPAAGYDGLEHSWEGALTLESPGYTDGRDHRRRYNWSGQADRPVTESQP